MNRTHRVHHRDWTLTVEYADDPCYSFFASPFAVTRPRYLLSLTVTPELAQWLMRVTGRPGQAGEGPYRGCPVLSARMDGTLRAEGVEVTEAEADQIAHGADPAGVLLGAGWPAGYRLTVVPVPLPGTGA